MTREEAVRYLLARAREGGFDVEVLARESRELTVSARDGSVTELKQASRGGVGIRALVDGRIGYAWSEELGPDALDWALAEARENAALLEEGDGFLPAGEALGRKDLLSEGLSAAVEEKVDTALTLEAELKRDERFARTQTARYMERDVEEVVASTKGADTGYRTGYTGLMADFVMRQGDSVKSAVGAHAGKEFHDLDPHRTALELLARTGRHLGARPLRTGRYRAYLEAAVVGALLRVLEASLSGKSVVEGKSRLAGRLGSRIASPCLTLVDDPDHPRGLQNRPSDSEGTPTRRLTLIEDGVLRSFLHNSATARKAGHENTGHAARDYRGTMGVGATNLVVPPGDGVEPVDGVLVTDLMGVHAGADPISGDVSLQGLGLRFEGGESHPVENFVISGNLFRMLEAIAAVGREPELDVLSGVVAPVVEVESLSFGGA